MSVLNQIANSSESGKQRTATEKNVSDARFAVTLKDYDAAKEQEETLEEYVTSKFSPYSVDYSWSDEAKGLREMAVKSPWLITPDFIHEHFKTLRISDKSVSELDDGLLNLHNLEELAVTANHITTIHSQNIPKSVKVLDLVANEIDDLEQLCADPPDLHHLGLGLNKISAIHDFITGAYWPSLLSLDLSHNNLCDLIDVINKMSTLPKLRNLVLLGNPLALIPGYRGFTIDSLRKLDILDDLRVSADEKHRFKGLARRKEYVLDEAKVTVKITAASGIQKPAEMLITEEVPQYPITTRTYYVEFMFLEDFQAKTKAKYDSKEKATEDEKTGGDKDEEKDVIANGDGKPTAGGDGEKTEQPVIKIETEDGTESDLPIQPTPEDPPSTPSPSLPPPPSLKLVPYRTKGITWSEEGFRYEYTQDIVIDDLPALKEYFKKGMQLAIKEDKVLSRPAEPEEGSEEGKQSSKKDKDADEWGEIRKTSSRMGPSRLANNASRAGASRMGNARMGASRMGKAPAPRTGASRMGNAPAARTGASRMGNAPTARTGASRMGKAPAPRTGASRMGKASTARTGASRMGNAPTARTGASRMGNAPRTGASRMGNAPRMGASRMGNRGAGSSMRAQSNLEDLNAAWPPADKPDKKKKKKEPEIELIHSPPEVTVLGTYALELAEFIDGEYMIEETSVCKGQEGTCSEEAAKEDEDGTDSKKEKKKKKERGESPKGKKGKDGKESKEGKDKDKGKRQPPKPDKKESKAKRPGSGKSQHSGDEEEEKQPPPPLTVTISVELHNWKTAQDSIPKPTVADKMALIEETITE